MALLPQQVAQSLCNFSFAKEFKDHKDDYLLVARLVARETIRHLKLNGVQLFDPTDPNDLKDFADKHLVEKVKIWLISDTKFLWFRQALKRGIRMYLDPCTYEVWSEMMARYVLNEAIEMCKLL